MSSWKPEFPPLLTPGFHVRSIPELWRLCVYDFPKSVTRQKIMNGFVSVMLRLARVGYAGEVWVDGSFMTNKIDPDDVDLVLPVPVDFYESGTPEQRFTIDWISEGLKQQYYCDSEVWFKHSDRSELGKRRNKSNLDYWRNRFGFSVTTKEPKGIARIWLPSGLIAPSGNV